MTKAICSGSFDPVTNGHLDIFRRAASMYDEVFVGVFNNINKKPFLSIEQRVEALKASTQDIKNIKVVAFDGLLVDYMLANDIRVVVRGLRSVTDYEYEQTNAQLMRAVHPEFDTVFMLCNPEYSFLSSSVVREIVSFGGDIARWVPKSVVEVINNRNI